MVFTIETKTMQELLTREEAATLMAIGVGMVDRFRSAGKLQTVRERRSIMDHHLRVFVKRVEVEELIRQREAREEAARRARVEARTTLLASLEI